MVADVPGHWPLVMWLQSKDLNYFFSLSNKQLTTQFFCWATMQRNLPMYVKKREKDMIQLTSKLGFYQLGKQFHITFTNTYKHNLSIILTAHLVLKNGHGRKRKGQLTVNHFPKQGHFKHLQYNRHQNKNSMFFLCDQHKRTLLWQEHKRDYGKM